MHVHVAESLAGSSEHEARAARRAIGLSLAVAVAVVVGKVGAAWLTGSSALLADALESIIHIAATAIAAFSVWYAQRPPDQGHPYGRERIVFFSAGMEGALISVAALGILVVSVEALVVGPEVRQLGLGLLLTAWLAFVNLALGRHLVRVGRRTGSLSVEANGHHTLTDVWTSSAILVGVGVVWLTGWVVLDPLVAILAALKILWTGFGLVRQSFAGLIGAADPEVAAALRGALAECQAEGVIADFHALRFRTEGRTVWVEVHVLVDGALSVVDAHGRATDVERRLERALGGTPVRVTTHVEPLAHRRAHPEGHRKAGDLSEVPEGGEPFGGG